MTHPWLIARQGCHGVDAGNASSFVFSSCPLSVPATRLARCFTSMPPRVEAYRRVSMQKILHASLHERQPWMQWQREGATGSMSRHLKLAVAQDPDWIWRREAEQDMPSACEGICASDTQKTHCSFQELVPLYRVWHVLLISS